MRYVLKREIGNDNYLKRIKEASYQSFMQIGGMCVIDINGKYLYINNVSAGYFDNRPESEITGKTIYEVLKDRPKEIGQFENAKKCGNLRTIVERDKNIFSTVYSPIRNEKGQFKEFIVFILDVTESVKEQREQAVINNRMIEAQSIANIGNFEYDIKNQKILWSEEIFNIFGLEEEKVNKNKMVDIDFIPKKYFDAVYNKILEAIDEDKSHVILKLDEIIDGDLWVKISYKVIYDDDGEAYAVRGTIQNVSERKRIEEEMIKARDMAEKILYDKSEFIANMSHELRTPINVLYGAIQLFEMYLKSGYELYENNITEHLVSMKRNCLRLIRLANNLIDTSKIDAGFYTPMFEKYNITEIIRNIVESVYDYANQKGIDISFEAPQEEILIVCDEDMIERIILNIISNAIKFTFNKILIKAKIQDGKLIISIIDNGIGIEADKKTLIFERYKQGTNLLTRTNEGCGIGLALTKAMIEMHNGNIYVKSKYGEGAEFVVELPFTNLSESDSGFNYRQSNNLIEKMQVEFSDIYR